MIRGHLYRNRFHGDYTVKLSDELGNDVDEMGPFDDELDAMLAMRRHADEVHDLAWGVE